MSKYTELADYLESEDKDIIHGYTYRSAQQIEDRIQLIGYRVELVGDVLMKLLLHLEKVNEQGE